MCRAMLFFSSRSERKHFLWRWYRRKKRKNGKIKIWFIVLCTLIDKYASLLLSQTFFSYRFCMLSDFANVFERKVWRVQVGHLHYAARALSSPSRCFQLSTKLGKDFFHYLWYCDKKQIECWLAWHSWNSTDLGLIDMFLRVTDREFREWLDRFEKSEILKLCSKNTFRELLSKILFQVP